MNKQEQTSVAPEEKVSETSLYWVRTYIVIVWPMHVLHVQVGNSETDSYNVEDTLRTSVVEASQVSDSESTLQEITRQLRE